jgi:protein-arginine deiminase
MLVRTCIAVVAFLGGSLLAAPAYAAPAADLRADVNRDGALSAADDAAEDQWTRARGAVVLPNLDDDQARCPKKLPDGKRIPDDALPTCQDAADAVVNGAADLADLARIRVQPVAGLPASARVTLTAGPRLRVFVHRGSSWVALPAGGKLTAAEARGGVELAVEATDLVSDLAVWDGMSDLTLRIVSGSATTTDRVRVRVAPLLFQHDLMTVRRLMVSDTYNELLVAGQRERRDILGRKLPQTLAALDPEEEKFRQDLRRGLDSAGLKQPFIEHPTRDDFGGDIWVQDQFEPGYASMPAVGGGGAEQRIRIDVRSANLSRSGGEAEGRPLREGGRNVFLKYRGPNTAGVQQYDPRRVTDPDSWQSDTFNSTGNFGAVPPYSHAGKAYPAGRMVYGSIGRWSPDSSFTKLLHAQGFQRPIVLDTSWLLVGHIDEFMSILPAKSKRGWILAVADPVLGEKLLNDLVARGKGGTRMFNGVPEGYLEKPELTVAQALRLATMRGANRIAERGIDRALAELRAETGITEREIARLPALFDQFDGLHGRTFAYLPGVANGIGTGTSTYLAPKQHGPIDGGKDVFQRVTETALAQHGVRVAWVEDWAYAHVGLGEIHCVTNAERDLTKTKPWWNERG